MLSSVKTKAVSGALLLFISIQCFPGRAMAYDVQAFIKEFAGSQVKVSDEIIKANKPKIKTSVNKVAEWYENKWLGGISFLENKTGLNEQCKPYKALKNYNLFNLGFNSGVVKGAGDLGAELYSLGAKIPTAPERIVNFGYNYAENPQKYKKMVTNGAQAVAGAVLNPVPVLSGLYGHGKNTYLEAVKDPVKFGNLHGEATAFIGSFLIGGGQVKALGSANKAKNAGVFAKATTTLKSLSFKDINIGALIPDFSRINIGGLGIPTPAVAASGKSVGTTTFKGQGWSKPLTMKIENIKVSPSSGGAGDFVSGISSNVVQNGNKVKYPLSSFQIQPEWMIYKKLPNKIAYQIKKWANETYSGYVSRLSAEEKAHLVRYTEDSENVNNILKGIKRNPTVKEIAEIDALKRILGDAPALEEKVVVFKGVMRERYVSILDLPLNKMKGQIIVEEGFMSTSILPLEDFTRGIDLVINVPKGSKGLYLRDISQHPKEFEILFEPGRKMMIRDIIPVDLGNSKDNLILFVDLLK